MGTDDALSGYRYQSLPDLSGRRDPEHARLSATQSVKLQIDPQLCDLNIGLQSVVRAAFAKVLLGYIDSPEFLFAELHSTLDRNARQRLALLRVNISNHGSWISFIHQIEEQAHLHTDVSPSSVRSTLGLPSETNPLPARFVCGKLQGLVSAYSDGVLLFGIPERQEDELVRSAGSIELCVVCDSAIMSQPALQNYLDQACATVTHILANPTTPPSSIVPLPKELKSAYEEDYDPSRAHVAVEWLMRNAATRPDAIAHEIYETLEEAPVLLTYAELNARSNRLANWFIKHGIQLEDKVAVCRARDEYFYVANAALFKCGACYTSIDPELPLERRQFIVRDSGAKFVVTTATLAPDFGDTALVPEDSNIAKDISQQSSKNICLAQLDSLAYLLYTSGTTGTPKGCLLNHRGLYWAIEAMCAYPRRVTNPGSDKRLALASIAFDVHISEICQTWCLGIRLVSAPRYEILADLQTNLIDLGITHAGMVPSMIEATLSGPDDLPLKYLVSGGEKISDSLLRKWANHPTLILANFYGPTEATIGCTSRLIKQTDRKENIGHPFPSCRAYVVDASMNIVPRGNPGELVVEGPLVGRGYHKLPEATAKAFKKWPTPESNTYCTGDLVRMMPDDTIEIMGRIDTQIKLRGVRIESEGVSNVLRKASERPLDVATLIAKHPDSGSELLVSFVAFGDRQVSVTERRSGHVELAHDFPPALMESLKSIAARELAVYMRPSHIIPVAFLPLSLNMKTDTKLLAEFFRVTPISILLEVQRERTIAERPLSPQTTGSLDADQVAIAEIVSRLSNTPLAKIRADSNLLECGMDSLRLSALARELRKLWPGSRVTVTDILTSPVLASVANIRHTSSHVGSVPNKSICESFGRAWQSTAESVFRPEDIEAVLPTFPVQEGVLFQALVSPTQYVQHFIYRVGEHVKSDNIYQAWVEMVRLHPILRAVFLVEDIPLQVVLHPEAVQVPLTTHHQLSATETESFTSWFHASEKDRVSVEINSDLTSPVFRINLYQSDSRFMVVSLSHAIYDGFALPNLMKDLDAAISGETTHESVSLQPILEAVELLQESAQHFWVQKLSSLDLKSLSSRRPARPRAQYARRILRLSYEEMQSSCRAQHTTLQALGCASYALAGRDYLGWRNDAVFGVIRSGRSLPVDDIDTTVAPLVSLVPFVLNLHGKASSEILDSSQSELASTLAFEHTQLGRIQRWLGVPSFFETLFSCRVEEQRSPYKSFEHCETKAPLTEFILSVEMLVKPGANIIELKAAFTEELDTEEVDNLLARLEYHFESLARGESVSSPTTEADTDRVLEPSDDQAKSQLATNVDPELQKRLADAVSSFLNTEPSLVKPDTSLVSLGLTSLKAVALSRKLKNSSIFVSPIDIIQADTIKNLVPKCSQAGSGSSVSSSDSEGNKWLDKIHQELNAELDMNSLKLSTEDKVHITCATALQAGMLSQTVSSDDRLYVHGFTFKLRADCSLEKLKHAWKHTLRDVSILRTSFEFAERLGRWVQVVHSEVDVPWTSIPFKDPSSALSEFISTLPFGDVSDFKQPPLRLCHFNTGGDDYLLVVLHHALYDGISLPLLFNRVRSNYHGVNLPPLVSFHDLVPQILISEHFGTSYWAQRLQGAKAFILPREPNTPAGAWRSSTECKLELADIQRTCRRYQVNVQCLGQAAMARLLSQMSGHDDVIFGQVISGRTLPGAEEAIGPVFNTIPCRIDLSSYRTLGDLLRGIQRSNNENLSYQHASLRSIQRELGVKALIDALFLFQPDTPAPTTGPPPIWDSLERSNKEETKTQYGLNIELHQTATGFVIRASCSAAVMDQTRLSKLLSEFSKTLRQVAVQPTTSIHDPHLSVVPRSTPSQKPRSPQNSTHREAISATPSSEFDGWSEAQLKFKDILIAFTKVPASTVHPDSQLAALGLDSISSVQLTGMAKRAGIKLSASDIAKCTTLADVAAIIAKKSASPQADPPTAPSRSLLDDQILAQARSNLPTSLQESVETFLPTTAGMDFIVSSWIRSGGWRFQHAFTFKVCPLTDSSKLHRAWDELVERHAILRSIFMHVGGRNIVCVLKPGSIRTPWIEVVTEADKDDLEEVGRIARQTVANPPLLRGGPASRVTYLHGKEGDYMVLEMHHALYDAWSFNMILRDLQDIYSRKAPTSRNDLAYLANAITSPNNVNEQRSYWETVFQGFSPSLVELPTCRTTPRQLSDVAGQLVKHAQTPLLLSLGLLQTAAMTRHQFSRTARLVAGTLAASGACLSAFALARHSNIDTSVQATRTYCVFRDLVFGFSALQGLTMEKGLPLHMVLLACWSKVQARRSNNRDQGVVFGLLHNGRRLEGVEDIAAPCINVLPVYVLKPLEDDAFAVAGALQSDLRGRSAVVEQSRLQDVSSWVGAPGKPLFHYFVNMLRVPSAGGNSKPSTNILERIKVPRSPTATQIPETSTFATSSQLPFAAMREVQDDCMIEVFFDSKRDSIGMEVSCKTNVLSEKEAKELAEAWGQEVLGAFRSPYSVV